MGPIGFTETTVNK